MANKTTVSEVMTSHPRSVRDTESVAQAAQIMSDLEIGAVPVCDADDHVLGMLTDRDIVVGVVGKGKSPENTTAGSVMHSDPITVPSDMHLDEALQLMMQHQVRRLPVADDSRLTGMLSMADVAVQIPQQRTGELAHALSFD